MALTRDQKKHLLIGGGVGALALVVGSALFGGRRAIAAPLLPARHAEERHEKHRKKRRDREGHEENERGEYGRKKKHHRKEHKRD